MNNRILSLLVILIVFSVLLLGVVNQSTLAGPWEQYDFEGETIRIAAFWDLGNETFFWCRRKTGSSGMGRGKI